MSGIISDSNLLQLEEDRVTLRNNLREQGIGCKDDETLESLIAKVDDLQSWNKLLDNSISGAIYSDTITSLETTILSNKPNVTSIILTLSNSANVRLDNNTSMKTLILPNISNTIQYIIEYCTSLEKIVLPRYNSTPGPNGLQFHYTPLSLLDFGSVATINGNVSLSSKPNFKYLILRKADTITTLDNTSRLSGSSPLTFVPQAQISNYESGTNWSATSCTFLVLEGSRFEDLDWWEDVYNQDGTPKNTCTLDGNLIETADNETVAIFKHTENIAHVYENGVELQDSDLVKGKTLTSTI